MLAKTPLAIYFLCIPLYVSIGKAQEYSKSIETILGPPSKKETHYQSLEKALREKDQAESLDLSHQVISKLSEEVGQLTRLKNLQLADCHLEALPLGVAQLKTLQTLDLSQNPSLDYEKVFELLASLPHLKELILDKNLLRTLPDDINKLTALRRLSLRENLLTELPPSFYLCTTLTEINLSYNQLSSLSSSIEKLAALKILRLGWNTLKALPVEINNLPKLEVLGVAYNYLHSISLVPRKLTHLKTLQLAENPIPESEYTRLSDLFPQTHKDF